MALNQVKDHMITSADDIYDMIPGLTRTPSEALD
jgi:hypothetical protein